MDLFPTILDAAGISDHGKIDGRSMFQEITAGGQKSFAGRDQIYTWLQGYKKHALRKVTGAKVTIEIKLNMFPDRS